MQPKIFHATDHDIDASLIDDDAVYVIKRLKEAGFQAFLVGGSVRDLLIKKKPKDYDISTSARPEQIKHIFQRQCLLIGKRFRLAHIRFGHKILEVSTFRSGENDSDLIVHDNCWGSPEEDVLRRDFTINGLFYDPETHQVIDYVGGWNDIHQHTLRTIGEPAMRFRQDPVRMIRLLKFKARFDFTIDPLAWTALKKCHEEILKSAPARILEEILRMLESGASERFFRLMVETEMLELLFPCLTFFLKGKHGEDVYSMLAIADKINLGNLKRPLDRGVLTACLVFPAVEREIETKFLRHGSFPSFGETLEIVSSLIHGIITSSFSHFPKRLSMLAGFILSTQYRLTPFTGKRLHRPKLFNNKEFDLAMQFLKLRALVTPSHMEAYDWWQHHLHTRDKHPDHLHPPEHVSATSEAIHAFDDGESDE